MTFRSALSTILAGAALCVGLGTASANVARHERIAQKPIVKAGKPVGVKISVVLRPEDQFTIARIGLGKMKADDVKKAIPKGGNSDTYIRQAGAGLKPGYLRFKGPEVKSLKAGVPKEVEFEVIYGKGNDLKPGDQVDVVTAWSGDSQKMYLDNDFKKQTPYWHIFGMFDGPVHSGDTANVIKLGDK